MHQPLPITDEEGVRNSNRQVVHRLRSRDRRHPLHGAIFPSTITPDHNSPAPDDPLLALDHSGARPRRKYGVPRLAEPNLRSRF
jgi:hypothetical protein